MAQLLKNLVTSEQSASTASRLLHATCETNAVVRDRIDTTLSEFSACDARLSQAINSAFLTKHDFDRALFVRIGFQSARGDWRLAVDALLSSELLYASVVILDDIVDSGEQRHGAPCLYQRLGVGPSIYIAELYRSLAVSTLLHACATLGLSAAAQTCLLERWELATRDVNTGQFLDVLPRTRHPEQITDDDYLALIEKTTGADIANCLATGATLAFADEGMIESLGVVGNLLGKAMQVRDDLLDYCVDHTAIDKSPGLDLINGRLRLPLIRACRSSAEARRLAVEVTGRNRESSVLADLRDAVLESDGLSHARTVLASLLRQVDEVLDNLPDSQSRQMLQDINSCLWVPTPPPFGQNSRIQASLEGVSP
jgi:octaprenyl-diphosphate synthase